MKPLNDLFHWKNKFTRSWKIAVYSFAAFAGLLLLALLFADFYIGQFEKRVYSDANEIPAREYGLVLGTSKIVQGKFLNVFFQNRIDAAVELYRKGKVRKLIVSGDNRRKGYNEPDDMRDALIEAGIPSGDILPDYAGFRTLDSVIRARNVFGVNSMTVISQEFHCARAIFIAEGNGIDALGFEAKEVPPRYRIKSFFREPAARLAALTDVWLLHRKPHFEY